MVLIRLRVPTAYERQWLSVDPRGNKHDDLLMLGYVKSASSKYYSHPAMTISSSSSSSSSNSNNNTKSTTWDSPDDVVASMLSSGIPNAHQLAPDRLMALQAAIRFRHVDFKCWTDAREGRQGLNPALATHVATDETIRDILAKLKVVVMDHGRITLAGVAVDGDTSLLQHGIHYVDSLDELRALLRQTGSTMAPGSKSVGRRQSNSITASERLALQLWAATAPYELPEFGTTDNTDTDTTASNSPIASLKRVVEPVEEEDDEEDDDDDSDEDEDEDHGDEANENKIDDNTRTDVDAAASRKTYKDDSTSEESDDANSDAGHHTTTTRRSNTTAHPRVSLDGDDNDSASDSPVVTSYRPTKKPRRHISKTSTSRVSMAHSKQPRSAADDEWLSLQKNQVLDLLFNDFKLGEPGMAVYQVLELQAPGCREYNAVQHSIQRGVANGHSLAVVVQRTIELLGRQCQRLLEETMAVKMAVDNEAGPVLI